MNIIKIILPLLLLQSCSTTILGHHKYKDFKYQTPESIKSKTATIRPYLMSTTFDRDIYLSKWEILDDVLIEKKDQFKKLELKTFLADAYRFRVFESDGKARLQKMLDTDFQASKTELFIDIHTESKIDSPHINPLRAVWALVHFLSLGLVPYTANEKVILIADVYDVKGKKIKSSKVVNYVPYWIWSPFMFRKDSKKAWDKELTKQYLGPMVDKLYEKTFEE